jgi:glycosyltransferase EpsE
MTKKVASASVKVSIVMAVFNESENVAIAIDSIINQSYKLWNLVIVDDGSTDDTAKIVQSYVDKHNNIELLINKTNRGLAYSLNKAISYSNSEYIARMDADDAALPNRLESQIKYFNEHSEIDVLGTGAEVVNINSSKSIVFKPENHTTILSSIEKINPFFHSSVMMRRNFIESIGGYDIKCLRAQDYDLWLRGVDGFKYHNLQEVLMIYSSRNQTFKSIYYGFRVRIVNAYRRDRIVIGSLQAILVFMYGLWVKTVGSFK